MRNIFLFVLFFVSILALGGSASNETLNSIADEYLKFYFESNPSMATALGVHDFDQRLEDYTQKAIRERVRRIKDFKERLSKTSSKGLSLGMKIDFDVLTNHLSAALLELEEVRSWEKNPDMYGSLVNNALYSLMSRKFAPPRTRLESVISRERAALSLLAAARSNLKKPPQIYTQIALEQLPGMVSFLEKDLPAAFSEVTDDKTQKVFKEVNRDLISAFKKYHNFLKNDLLPRSNGDFRLGKNLFEKKLKYEEAVTLPLERLEEIGLRDLRANQEAFKKISSELNPKYSPKEVLEWLTKDRPAPSKLLDAVRSATHEVKAFVIEQHVITLPSLVDPIVQETPPFQRALLFASMDSPGPFEANASEAYYNVTPPEKNWPPKKIEEYMAGFNYAVISSTSIHEAYPGHYTQFLWVPKVGSRVRKVFGANTNIEGWAHYSEQMMLDQGFGKGDRKLRLGQLQDALLRNGRYLVGLRLHTGKMSIEEGIAFFMKEGYLTRANAERETKRGTADPLYMYYTLGKLQILKLREDYQRKKGKDYRIHEFHDAFMKQGLAPIRLIRKALLGEDSEGL